MDPVILERSTEAPELKLRNYMKFLERVNGAIDTTAYVMVRQEREKCVSVVGELVKLVVKLSVLAEDAINQSGPDAAALTQEANQYIDKLTEQKSRVSTIESVEVAKDVEAIVMSALGTAEESLNSIAHESIVMTDNFEDDGSKFQTISLMYSTTLPQDKKAYCDGVDVEWRDDKLHMLRVYRDGEIDWYFRMDEDQNGGEFINPAVEEFIEEQESGSIAPLVGSAALLATAAVMKFASKKSSAVMPVSKPSQISQEAV